MFLSFRYSADLCRSRLVTRYPEWSSFSEISFLSTLTSLESVSDKLNKTGTAEVGAIFEARNENAKFLKLSKGGLWDF